MTAYQDLESRFARQGAVKEAMSVLYWDNATVMPTGGAGDRQAQIMTLEGIAHEMVTMPDLGGMLDRAETQNELDPWQRANIREMRRTWLHATAVPASLVEAHVKASLECEMIWREARPADDFAAVKPALQKTLDLTREIAVAKAEKFGVSRYDALLDQYEPDGKSAEIDRLFDDLCGFLPETIAAIIEHQARKPAPLEPEGPFPIEAQRRLGLRMMAAIGFDFDHGRLDVSLHPFCGGTPDDVRITTRYEEDNFSRALMGVLHETGHAMYERGLPAAWRRQPVGHARGMSLHESQSLLIEMQACRSRSFMEFAAPVIAETFGGTGAAYSVDNLYRHNTRVKRSLIRVDADEATYPAHVILRYHLEKAMIEGDLGLDDLPGAWNDGMQELVGITPPNDRYGCLQDIHWYSGSFGYFPTYTLGAMTAAQLFAAATEQEPRILPALERGDFVPLMAWLRQNIHGRAASVSAETLLKDATGSRLETTAFKAHLRRRYLEA